MRVLLACEESGTFREAFRALGHDAVSVDIEPASDGSEFHFQMDIKRFLAINSQPFDLVIAFPPCTHLARSGAKHWHLKQADGRQQEAIDFFMYFVDLHRNMPKRFPRVVIENSVGIMSSKYRKADQIVHPYHFGDPFQKQTCFWIHGDLPELMPTATEPYDKGEMHVTKSGKVMPKWYCLPESKTRGAQRSKSFPGIAHAAAKQWGGWVSLKKGEKGHFY